jgi:hypothetical protein
MRAALRAAAKLSPLTTIIEHFPNGTPTAAWITALGKDGVIQREGDCQKDRGYESQHGRGGSFKAVEETDRS